MLIWIGTHHGGPATIQGFESLAACEAAKAIVGQGIRKGLYSSSNYYHCVELDRR